MYHKSEMQNQQVSLKFLREEHEQQTLSHKEVLDLLQKIDL